MQVLRLTFEGIGPFAGRHTIDFAELGAGGLFLLEGPTGSGKTTIIDALVFALYGDVAGSDSSKGRIVSTKLPRGVEPFVEATIETARGLYRVRRVPQHERPKARGRGTTIGKAAIQLWRLASLDDAGVQVSTSFQDASEELQRAIGLTKEQFTQTVVLPQGDFATFLRAKPDERRGVLQDIFGTKFYERCARQLAELAAEHRRQYTEAAEATRAAASAFAAVALREDEGDDFIDLVEGDPGAALERVATRATELRSLAEAAGSRAEAAARHCVAVDGALQSARERNALVTEHRQLLSRLAGLRDAEAAVAADEVILAAAERAERTRRAVDAAERARVAWDAARADMVRGHDHLLASPDADLGEGEVAADELERAEVAAREERSALTGLVELESGLRSRADQLRGEVDRLAAEQAKLQREQAGVGRDRARVAELMPELTAVAELAETRAECLADEVAARSTVDALRRLEEISAEYVQARRAEVAAEQTASVAQAAHQQARTTWLAGLAGTLAAELTPGGECPVCGGREHPRLAQIPAGTATREEVERLDDAARAAATLWTKAQANSDALATAMSDQTRHVGDRTRVEAERTLAEATDRLRAAERAGEQATELRRTIQRLTDSAESREQRLRGAEKSLAGDRARIDERAQRLADDRVRVEEAFAGFASVAERSERLARRAERARRLARLVRAAVDASEESEKRSRELTSVLAEEGFADVRAARGALLDGPSRQRLRHTIDEHRRHLASTTDALASDRFAGAADLEPVDLAPLVADAERARAALAEAQRSRGALQSSADAAAVSADRLGERIEQGRQAREAAEPYLRMADVANGGESNLADLTLPTFVLLRRFEEVVDLANARLDAMTRGRYSLRRTDAREGRSHKAGLGLEVIDHASGDAARDPKTLSGGETFQASLAMALGLADAVTAEAGGVELRTLFVDEGFGSLDPDALDTVMDQLTALRDGGRSVGVVSHVAEMKQRIADRISVVPLRDGTSTLHCSTDPQQMLAG